MQRCKSDQRGQRSTLNENKKAQHLNSKVTPDQYSPMIQCFLAKCPKPATSDNQQWAV